HEAKATHVSFSVALGRGCRLVITYSSIRVSVVPTHPRERPVMSDPVPNGVGARPADRYGTQAANRPAWLLPLVALVVLLAGAGVAYLGFQKYGPAEIEAEELGYTVVDDETVRLRFKVTRTDPATPVVCFVRAIDRDTVEV